MWGMLFAILEGGGGVFLEPGKVIESAEDLRDQGVGAGLASVLLDAIDDFLSAVENGCSEVT